jgi:hypothetical protein
VGIACLLRLRSRRRPAPEPPDWQQEFVQLARDLLTVCDPLIEALGRRPEPARGGAATPAAPKQEPGLRLVHDAEPAEPRRRRSPLPAELRLIESVAAARAATVRSQD